MRPTRALRRNHEIVRNLPNNSTDLSSPLRKLVAVVATATVVGIAVMFSVVLVAVVLFSGSLALGYFWWKTRDLRKQMHSHPGRDVVMESVIVENHVIKGEVIEGEATRVDDNQKTE